jgi:hypothetical protein
MSLRSSGDIEGSEFSVKILSRGSIIGEKNIFFAPIRDWEKIQKAIQSRDSKMQHHGVYQAQALVINTTKRVKKRLGPSKENRQHEKCKSEKKEHKYSRKFAC